MRTWLKEIRMHKELSQHDVATRASISQQYYSAIESGWKRYRVPVETAKRIAAVLEFEWTRFFEEDTQAGEVENHGHI